MANSIRHRGYTNMPKKLLTIKDYANIALDLFLTEISSSFIDSAPYVKVIRTFSTPQGLAQALLQLHLGSKGRAHPKRIFPSMQTSEMKYWVRGVWMRWGGGRQNYTSTRGPKPRS